MKISVAAGVLSLAVFATAAAAQTAKPSYSETRPTYAAPNPAKPSGPTIAKSAAPVSEGLKGTCVKSVAVNKRECNGANETGDIIYAQSGKPACSEPYSCKLSVEDDKGFSSIVSSGACEKKKYTYTALCVK